MPAPDNLIARRARLPAMFLAGSSGIEIAARDAATPVPPGVRVRYVDEAARSTLASHDPRADAQHGGNVIVDDGETLATFTDASVDFIIANRLLDRSTDPMAVLRRHVAVVRPAGWLFYALAAGKPSAWLAFIVSARKRLDGAFECRYFEFTGDETLCVLRRS